MEKSVGTLIRLTKLTETSYIVSWSTAEHGVIKTVAKGARRPKSSFAGKLDLFFKADIDWKVSAKSELHSLKDVFVRDYRTELRRDYHNLQMATYFAKLLESVMENDTPAPELHDLLERALDYLCQQKANKKALLYYESQLAELLGLGAKRASAHAAISEISGVFLRDRSEILKNISDLH